MTARQSRLDIIKGIIQTQEIGSQDELAQALSKEGV
ncbi:MAG: arginine repressor, partial [Bacteroidaceae bacterium]|nr:arginine repressor [Bacteroidaceae bacterium]